MITLSTWPAVTHENQYLQLYYGALAHHDVVLGPLLEINDRFLMNNRGRVQVLHVQWGPEQFWRSRGTRWYHRLRGVLGLRSFFKLARSMGIRIVWTLHDIEHHEGSSLIDRLGYRVLTKYADLCICHDDFTAEQFVQRLGGRAEQTVVMPHGNYDGVFPAPAPRTQTLERLGLDPTRKTLVCQGFVRHYKRFDLAMDALGELRDDYQLIIAGHPIDASYGDELRRRGEGLPRCRMLLKKLTDQELADLVNASDCVLLPYDKITGSGALLTVATLGRGVVASDLPYFRGLLQLEPNAGVLFESGNVHALADAIRRFFEESPASRGQAARRIADRFAWDEVVQPVVAWFRQTFAQQITNRHLGVVVPSENN